MITSLSTTKIVFFHLPQSYLNSNCRPFVAVSSSHSQVQLGGDYCDLIN